MSRESEAESRARKMCRLSSHVDKEVCVVMSRLQRSRGREAGSIPTENQSKIFSGTTSPVIAQALVRNDSDLRKLVLLN